MRRSPGTAHAVGVGFVVLALLAAGCSTGSDDADADASDPPTTPVAATEPSGTTATAPGATSTTSTTTTTTSTTSTSTTSTTTSTTIAVPDVPGALDLTAPVVGLGRSVNGAPIVAERIGELGGRPVVVIGVIHGDEDDGVAIIDELRSNPVPAGVELWLIESMNPDGQAAQVRQNANGVDLNRNFPYKWGVIGAPGDSQYAGIGPASEPETQAIVNFVGQLRPEIVIWYHQDLFVISPAEGREGRVRARYAELTNWPRGGISGGTYTGVAATWARNELSSDDGVAFIVELGPTLSPEDAELHANAVRIVGAEG
ncbi:MAG: M14 family zinc carboxypeptidase [Ilumatobacteraceae bacterium]